MYNTENIKTLRTIITSLQGNEVSRKQLVEAAKSAGHSEEFTYPAIRVKDSKASTRGMYKLQTMVDGLDMLLTKQANKEANKGKSVKSSNPAKPAAKQKAKEKAKKVKPTKSVVFSDEIPEKLSASSIPTADMYDETVGGILAVTQDDVDDELKNLRTSL